MNIIYENSVKGCGSHIDEFEESGFFITFGESAPEELIDYCYAVEVAPLAQPIVPGNVVRFDDQEYRVTAVGTEALTTLRALGHCTWNFSGATEVEMPGTIYLENKPMPEVRIGTKIRVLA